MFIRFISCKKVIECYILHFHNVCEIRKNQKESEK